MPLQYPVVAVDQLADDTDFARANENSYGNLKLGLLQALLGPNGTSGVLRGLLLEPNSPAGMAVVLKPGAAFDPTGELVILEADTLLNVTPAHATLARIDLVSIAGAATPVTPEERLFINDTVEPPVTYPSMVNTQRRIVPTPVITAGAPASSPSPPATPAGHLPLWEVMVLPAATEITADSIQRSGSPPIVGADRLVAMVFPGEGPSPQTLPWNSAAAGGLLQVPASSISLLAASVTMHVNAAGLFDFRIVDIATSGVVAQARRRVEVEQTVMFAGVRLGSQKAATYRVEIAVASGDVPLVVLPTSHSGIGGVVANFIVGISV